MYRMQQFELAHAWLGEMQADERVQAGVDGSAQSDLGRGVHCRHQPALAGARGAGRPKLRLQLRWCAGAALCLALQRGF